MKQNSGMSKPIHAAAYACNEDAILRLLDDGENINAIGDCGVTPLHCAVVGGSLAIVAMLVYLGADIHAKCDNGDTPIDVAINEIRPKISEYLSAKMGGEK